ncbi:MAG: pyridoxal phosphate-dependent aminotransferase [Bifidobacteriaceae bacterium]|nr:pyridoxal phosphate-dependent aminotransferase [Bifidobacteriaceae bacterium]
MELSLSDRVNAVAPSVTLVVDSKAKAMKAAGIDVIRYGAGEPDFPTPEAIVNAAIEAAKDSKNHKYTPTVGLPEFREGIARKTLRDSGYEITPDQVIVTNGGKQAVYESFQAVINPGDEAIIPAPYWVTYPEAVKLAGGTPVFVTATAEQGYVPTLEQIESARTERTKAIIINSPNNPTGAVWPAETLKAIGEWALEHGIWVISDEIYEHLVYDGVKTAHIGALVPELRPQLLVLNGLAKTYAMTGWRVGWMIADPRVIKAVSKLQGHMTGNVDDVAQRAGIEAVNGPLDAAAMMREAFDRRRRAIVGALNSIPGVSCVMPKGAFYAFADVHELLGRPVGPQGTVSATSTDLAEALLNEARVAAVPGEAFGMPGYMRFSYALADDDLAEGMRRFKKWVEETH